MSIFTENAKNKQYLRVHWQKKLAKQAWKIAQTDGVCPSARFYDYARAARGQAWNSLTDYIFRSGPRKQPYACLITRQKGWRVDIFCRHFQQRLHYKVNGEQNQNILKVTFRVMVSLNVNNAMSTKWWEYATACEQGQSAETCYIEIYWEKKYRKGLLSIKRSERKIKYIMI